MTAPIAKGSPFFRRVEGGGLGATGWRVDDDDVGILTGGDDPVVQPVEGGDVAGACRDQTRDVELAESGDVGHRVDQAERHHAAAGGCVGADDESIERTVARRQLGAQDAGAEVSRGAHLHRDGRLEDDRFEVLVVDGDRPAVDVERDVRVDVEQILPCHGERAGNRAPTRVQRGEQAGLLRHRDELDVVRRAGHRAEPRFAEPHARPAHFVEVRLLEDGLEDQ